MFFILLKIGCGSSAAWVMFVDILSMMGGDSSAGYLMFVDILL